jgi:hypothetical protein
VQVMMHAIMLVEAMDDGGVYDNISLTIGGKSFCVAHKHD